MGQKAFHFNAGALLVENDGARINTTITAVKFGNAGSWHEVNVAGDSAFGEDVVIARCQS